MMYAVLSLGLALLGGIVRLAQMLRLSVPLLYGALVITVFRPWYLAHTALADAVMGGNANSSGAGDDLVSKVWPPCQALLFDKVSESLTGFGGFTEPGFQRLPLLTRLSEAL